MQRLFDIVFSLGALAVLAVFSDSDHDHPSLHRRG